MSEPAMRRMCECDVCGAAVGHLTRVVAYGIETFACDACIGWEAPMPEDEEEPEEGW